MITNKEVFIDKTPVLTSEYVENELKKQGLNVLKWAIVEVKKDCYKLNVAIIK
jgi:hypothetical protein